MEADKQKAWVWDMLSEEEKQEFELIADQIWDYAETRYKEEKSSLLQEEFLERKGFTIEKEIGKIKTAFKASWGKGHPVIGFLGEFDALPGLSQKADSSSKDPVQCGGPGHGCGHNLLGTGCMEAAVLLKKYMEENALPGTVIYFGCPAEESGAGKAFMVREGCFDGVDFAFSWHPSAKCGLMNQSLANVRIIFDFHGKSSHAAAAPEFGRSALDACELTNIGVQYLREHVPSTVRMHSAYLNCGGDAPNVIPAEASLLYALRAPHSSQVKELIERVSEVGRGAAIMTGTRVDTRLVSAYAEILGVDEMDRLLAAAMQEVLPISYTEEEMAYAARFAEAAGLKEGLPVLDQSYPHPEDFSSSGTSGEKIKGISLGSTDVGNVSWIVPTGTIVITTMANGTPGHSWCLTAQGKSSIAWKGMHAAAEILALSAGRLVTDPKKQEAVKQSFEKAKKGEEYINLLPDKTNPGDF